MKINGPVLYSVYYINMGFLLDFYKYSDKVLFTKMYTTKRFLNQLLNTTFRSNFSGYLFTFVLLKLAYILGINGFWSLNMQMRRNFMITSNSLSVLG